MYCMVNKDEEEKDLHLHEIQIVIIFGLKHYFRKHSRVSFLVLATGSSMVIQL